LRQKIFLNHKWAFHLDELRIPPKKIAKKAYAFGGFTASLLEEKQDRLSIGAGGSHFLKLIAQGNQELGLKKLCDTDMESKLDNSWVNVDIPHDWKVALPYVDQPANLMSGSKEDGVGYYRKRFKLDECLTAENRVFLHFDGITRMADVWLNGAYLGHHNSGYSPFSFDITEMAYYGEEGENTILVRAETTSGAEGWWYEGAGIYKDVYLEVLPKACLNEDDFYVYTKKIQGNRALLGIEGSVTNKHFNPVEVAPKVQIGNNVKSFDKKILKAGESYEFQTEWTLDNVTLWTPETPTLYKVKMMIENDCVIKELGIHTYSYDHTGFKLNGCPYELHGVCEHQDFSGIGVALQQDVIDYKIKTMKEMGVNAYRSAHHFASKELLNACDKYGLLVINENRIPESSPWRIEDLKQVVKQTRMHASIAFWSIGNEELIGNTSYGSRTMQYLAQTIKALDYEHLTISAELLNTKGIVLEEYLQHFDILGVNYPEAGVMGEGAEIIKKQHPTLPMMSTENGSYFSTRGIYKDDAERCFCNNFGSMYSMILPGKRTPGEPGVGGTARPEEVMAYLRTHKYMGGVFLWTAFDYFGEPAPFDFPGIGSQFGICDMNGFPKDYYYYYQAQWTTTPMVHIMPHWNRKGLDIDKEGKTRVRVFTNGDQVELILNGKSFGKKDVYDCQAEWRIEYKPGQLEARAYRNQQEVAQAEKVTSQSTYSIEQAVHYSGKEIELIEIYAVDKAGIKVPDAEDQVVINSSLGKIIGLGNGNPSNIADYNLSTIRLFSGKAMVLVQKEDGMNSQLKVKLVSTK
jgi:beta-galactosidase